MGHNTKYKKLDTLVARAIKGDKKSFEKLCAIEAAQIIYSCTKLMRNTLDGEDAAQEVFISMQRCLPTLKTPEAFVTWVQKMIYYVCGNMRQKNMKHVNTLPIEEFADLFSETDSDFLPEEYIYKKEKSKELMKAIDNLPEQIRTCIFMHYFNEMKIFEIADVLEITEGSVKGYLYVGREKIRKALQERTQPVYLHSAALLPMAALGQLFRQEMQALVTPAMVHQCLACAGITPPAPAGLFALPAIKDMAIAAACTLAAASTLSVYAAIHANAPAIVPVHQPPPQSTLIQTGNNKNEDAAPGLPPKEGARGNAGAKPTTQSGATPAASGGKSTQAPPKEETPESPPAFESPPVFERPPAAGATAVKGFLAVKSAESLNNLGQLFDKQYYATIEQNGQQFALTMIDSNGQFSFNNIPIVRGGTYTLHIKNVYSHSLVFSTDNPSGAMDVTLTPGQTFTLAQPLWVVDDEPPVVAVNILSNDGTRNPINPAIIQIDAHDATKLTTSWEIQAVESDAVVAQGSVQQVDSGILNGLQEGYYRILIHVVDALGNETEISGAFYAGKS